MMEMKQMLLNKIADRKIVAGIVGLGYVGLPLAVEKAKAGFRTIGFDLQDKKVEMVNAGHNYIGDVVDEDLAKLAKSKKLSATTDFSFIKDVDFIAICVPTPLDEHQEPDISYVRDSVIAVSKYLTKGTMVVLESTTYPGTTEELIKPLLEKGSGLECGKDFYLGFSPERVDPGNKLYHTKNTPKVVGAIGEDAAEVIAAMYRAVLDGEIYTVSCPAVAEMEKILENTYRNINIGLVNELGRLCKAMGISIWEVIDAAKTKPYGFQAFYPGPGLGGHCIPLDPYYILNEHKKAINGAKVLVLGVAYKQDIDDYRESPAIRVIKELKKVGAKLSYFDPWVPEFTNMYGESGKSLAALTPEVIAEFDLVIVTCAHTNVDYAMVQANAKAIFDTKNAMKNIYPRNNIEVL